MRKKIVAQRATFNQSIQTLTCLVKPDRELKRIDAVITQNPKLIELVHQDLTGDVSTDTGANDMSSELVLLIAIAKQLKQYPWRELAQRINDGIWLRCWKPTLCMTISKVAKYTSPISAPDLSKH